MVIKGKKSLFLSSPEEQSIVHALWDKCTLFLYLLPDCLKSVLLWHR